MLAICIIPKINCIYIWLLICCQINAWRLVIRDASPNDMCFIQIQHKVIYSRLRSWRFTWLAPGEAKSQFNMSSHDDVIKWKHFPRYWPFVRVIHRWPVNSPHKGRWRGALVFSLICASIHGWVNNHKGGDLRRHLAHYDVIIMDYFSAKPLTWKRDDEIQNYLIQNIYIILFRALGQRCAISYEI